MRVRDEAAPLSKITRGRKFTCTRPPDSHTIRLGRRGNGALNRMAQRNPQPAPLYPWSRLEDETDKAYSAFTQFLEFGPGRSIFQAYQKANPGKRGETTWEVWSRKYDWIARSRHYDNHQVHVQQQAREKAVREQAKVWANRQEIAQEMEWQTGVKMLNRVRRLLDNEDRALNNIAAVADVGIKMMRRAAKMPTEIEAAPPANWGSVLFETAGQLASVLPSGSTPDFPVDVLARPSIGAASANGNGDRLAFQPSRAPRPE
jgi:hypothetical protein